MLHFDFKNNKKLLSTCVKLHISYLLALKSWQIVFKNVCAAKMHKIGLETAPVASV